MKRFSPAELRRVLLFIASYQSTIMSVGSFLFGVFSAIMGIFIILGAVVFGFYLWPVALLGVLILFIAVFVLIPFAIAGELAGALLSRGSRTREVHYDVRTGEPVVEKDRGTGAIWYIGLFIGIVGVLLAIPMLGTPYGIILFAFGLVLLAYLFSPRVRKEYL